MTKADTLIGLKKKLKLSVIPSSYKFTVQEWERNSERIISEIKRKFVPKRIIVRSSALMEDQPNFSNAGLFASVLDVDSIDTEQIYSSVKKVIDSFLDSGAQHPLNQVLIQEQILNVKMSGVLFTRNNKNGAPYYLINYDDKSQKTDKVTSGKIGTKLEIYHQTSMAFIPICWTKLIDAIKEIETVFDKKYLGLDIEFVSSLEGSIYILQVRFLVIKENIPSYNWLLEILDRCVNKYQYHKNLLKEIGVNKLIFSDMSFWNPAEIIGEHPHPLDYSVYKYLILNDNWNHRLVEMNYTEVEAPLMIQFAGKPYINVQYAFLSLLPSSLPTFLKYKISNYASDLLESSPELHDKIEFEIIPNCFHLALPKTFKGIYQRLNKQEKELLTNNLLMLTQNIVHNCEDFFEKQRVDLENLKKMRVRIVQANENRPLLDYAFDLLDNCRSFGVPPFVQVARMAFIAESMLLNLCNEGVLSQLEYEVIYSNIETPASKFLGPKMSENDFSHLRPGTYDITTVPYAKSVDQMLLRKSAFLRNQSSPTKITHIFAKAGALLNALRVTPEKLMFFICESIKLREWYKLEFTKDISLALEVIAQYAHSNDFSRFGISMLSLHDLANMKSFTNNQQKKMMRKISTQNLERYQKETTVCLPPIITSSSDFFFVQHHNAKPNYVTNKRIKAEIVVFEDESQNVSLEGKIVVIRNADPGYDWIFSHNIAGLITKFGGVASHMAIRCNELKIPAALGCGDVIFNEIKQCKEIILDCQKKIIVKI